MFSSRATINLGSRSVSILEKEKEIWSRGWQGVERRIYIYILYNVGRGEIWITDYLVVFLSVGSSNEQPRFQICRNAYVIGDNVGGIDLRHDVPAKLNAYV